MVQIEQTMMPCSTASDLAAIILRLSDQFQSTFGTYMADMEDSRETCIIRKLQLIQYGGGFTERRTCKAMQGFICKQLLLLAMNSEQPLVSFFCKNIVHHSLHGFGDDSHVSSGLRGKH